ncbi:HNH endonuclease family protein, partial [Streptomyces griseoaurantiacus]|uniref:HNH endonuclease family protein n=1 Tax=Streptomyces griseoaurantiacus TaxID=68213 RepID=UPI0037A32C34
DMADDPHALYKVWPTHIDRASFRDIVDGRLRRATDVEAPAAPGASTLVRAYWFFRDRTVEWAQELSYESTADEGFDALVRVVRDKFELVVIDLEPEDNAQVIFEALNDRGTPLQASDLVKNLVFQKAEEQGLPVEELYRDVWARLETSDWRQEVRQGRLKRPRLDVFLTQYLTCELAEEVLTPELFLTFRRYVADSESPLTELMRHMVDRADAYRQLTAAEQPATPEGRLLRTVGVLDANTVLPVLLWLVTRFGEDDRAGAMRALDSYLVRRTVCRLTTKNYNRLVLELLKELKAKDDPAVVADFLLRQDADSGYWPRDHDIRYVFRSQPLYKHLTRARLRLVLAELEATLYSGKTERIVHDGELTIEHLLPQSWEAHWPLPDDEGRGSVEARQRREALVHTLGNLTLLTGKLNPAVSNGPWEHKRAEILRHSALSLNRSLAERWDEGTILARADHLAEAFCRRWQRPEGGPPALPAASLPVSSGATAQPNAPVDGPAMLKVPQARRDVALHMREVFAGLPVGSVLTVAQIAAAATSQYEADEISAGAVTARLHSDNVPGIRAVPGSSPLSARKIT